MLEMLIGGGIMFLGVLTGAGIMSKSNKEEEERKDRL